MSFKKLNAVLLFSIITLSPSVIFAGEIEDSAITAEVKLKLAAEKDIPAQSIEVETNNKVVNLRGTLDTGLQLHRAVEIASSIDNVDDVLSDELNVKDSKSLIADSVITAKVKGKIRHLYIYKKIGANYDLHVETTDGTVHIFGKVPNSRDVNTITSAVKEIKGVKSVQTNIK
jgi:hyperosmotically inducible protein